MYGRLSLSRYPFTDANIRLTGLLSFMLSDEMTTGSVTSSDAHKRVFAQRSHAWNVLQHRFKDAFPEVSHCIPPLVLSLCAVNGMR